MSIRFTHPRRGRVALAAIALGCGVTLAGCAGSGGDAEAGKKKFAACAGCHTLEDAGATGSSNPATGGPNLDDAFRQARQAGMPESQFAGVVHRWIQEAQPPMPRDLVTGQDAKDVAAYVASVAGKSPDSAVVPAGKETPAVTPVDFLP